MTDLTLLELLDLERIDRDLFRASAVFAEPFASYGGQVAAQARRAAGDTVPPDRFAHSLHGYHPRRGDAATARPAPPHRRQRPRPPHRHHPRDSTGDLVAGLTQETLFRHRRTPGPPAPITG